MRLKRANGRGQLRRTNNTSRVPAAAPRATTQSPATARSSALTVEHLNEAVRCAREGALSVAQNRALNQAKNEKCGELFF